MHSPRMLKRALWAILLISALAAPLFAATEVVVDGYGTDRDTALRDAQRNAVATVVGQMVSSRSLVSNYALVSDRILTSSQGYVKTYQVVDEGPSPAGYHVRIRAVVDTASVRNDVDAIAVLKAARGNPRFIVVPDPSPTADAFRPSDPAVGQAEMGIKEYLSERQFDLIQAPPYNVTTGLTSPAALKDLSMWGAGLGAEYVIYYSVMGLKEQGGRTFQRATAIVNITVVNTGTYQVAAQVEGRAVGSDQHEQLAYRKAARLAGKNAAALAVDKVLSAWSRTGSTAGLVVTLNLRNVTGDQLTSFVEALQRSGAVKMVNQRSFTDGNASLQVTLDGTLGDLGEAVGEVMQEKGWHWALVASEGNSLTYRVPDEVMPAAEKPATDNK